MKRYNNTEINQFVAFSYLMFLWPSHQRVRFGTIAEARKHYFMYSLKEALHHEIEHVLTIVTSFDGRQLDPFQEKIEKTLWIGLWSNER